MKVLQKKICVLGDFGVGKTSLIGRFVKNTFSKKYLTTVGVKMDMKAIMVDETRTIKLIIWDIAGESKFKKIAQTYLRGAAAFLLVIDGTRLITLEAALDIKQNILQYQEAIPIFILINKADLSTQWEVKAADIERLETPKDRIFLTSAKEGEQIEEAFISLSHLLAS